MTHRDHVDNAIDDVARQLTQVAGDDLLAARIVAALPERHAWFGGWSFRFAALAAIGVGLTMWFGVNRPAPLLLNAATPSLAALMVPIQPLEPGTLETPGTKPLERLEPLEPLEPLDPEHERSLPSLVVRDLVAESLSEDGLLSVESLEVSDLALASEFLSPIEE